MAHTRATIATLTLLGAICVGSLSAQDENRRYGYIRLLEGRASVLEPGSTDEIEAEEQSPLLTSDRLRVGRSSRLEAVLADLSHLRLDADTEVELTTLADSADQSAQRTSLRLLTGRLQLTVIDPPLPANSPSIVTSNASVFVQGRGVVIVAVSHTDRTQVTVREGYAEVLTDRGSSLVRANESAFIDGTTDVGVEIVAALPPDDFENWATDQEDRLAAVGSPEVDARLRYDAAALEGQGDWVEIEGTTAWRPEVDDNWQPYWNGRWSYTPTGLSWISYDPWGWVPYHYGGWDYHSHWGWLWFPGNVFAAAHVQWYWGPTHVGWVPQRYYHHHHRRFYGHGPSHYAYSAHSDWRRYDRWTFCPTESMGSRHQRRAHRHTSTFRDRADGAVPRGLISSGSAGLQRETWRQPGEAHRAFRRRDLEAGADRSGRAQLSARRSFQRDSQPTSRPADGSTRSATHRNVAGGSFEGRESVRAATRPVRRSRGVAAAEVLRRGDALTSWGGERSASGRGVVRRSRADTAPESRSSAVSGEGARDGSRHRGMRIWQIDKATHPTSRGPRTGSVQSGSRSGREALTPSRVRTSPSAIGAYSRSPAVSPSRGPSRSGSSRVGTRSPASRPTSVGSTSARPPSRGGVSSSSVSRSPSRASSSSRPSSTSSRSTNRSSGRSSTAGSGRVGARGRH